MSSGAARLTSLPSFSPTAIWWCTAFSTPPSVTRAPAKTPAERGAADVGCGRGWRLTAGYFGRRRCSAARHAGERLGAAPSGEPLHDIILSPRFGARPVAGVHGSRESVAR